MVANGRFALQIAFRKALGLPCQPAGDVKRIGAFGAKNAVQLTVRARAKTI